MTLSQRAAQLAGPDRAVDAEVAVALSSAPDARVVWMKGQRWFSKPGPGRIPFAGCGGKGVRLGLIFQQKRFTGDLNAAMTAVPDGWSWFRLSNDASGRWCCQLANGAAEEASAWAATPALALLSAALAAWGL